MKPLSTPAVILSAMRYGETSKIVRLATRDCGVQSAIAKGALRPRSRFGAALQVLSEGQAHLLFSSHRDLHTLTGFDLATLRVRLSEDLGRYAAATVLAELMLRVTPPDPHPEAYDALGAGLTGLETAPAPGVAAAGLTAIWRLVTALGFAPGLTLCVRDGRPVSPEGDVSFSVSEGGVLCGTCAAAVEHTELPSAAREAIGAMVAGQPVELPADPRHLTAHRRLLGRYIRYHVAEEARLPALEFWQTGGGAVVGSDR